MERLQPGDRLIFVGCVASVADLYKISDYLRIGVPLNLLVAASTVTIAPLIWPF